MLLAGLTNEKIIAGRPIAVLIVSILVFIAVMPAMGELLLRNPLEVAFVYPPRPIIDQFYYFLVDIPLLLVCIISSIAVIQRQSWARLVAIGSLIAVFSVHFLANITVGRDASGQGFTGSFDGSLGRYATIIISLVGLNLLSRKEVKNYLKPVRSI